MVPFQRRTSARELEHFSPWIYSHKPDSTFRPSSSIPAQNSVSINMEKKSNDKKKFVLKFKLRLCCLVVITALEEIVIRVVRRFLEETRCAKVFIALSALPAESSDFFYTTIDNPITKYVWMRSISNGGIIQDLE